MLIGWTWTEERNLIGPRPRQTITNLGPFHYRSGNKFPFLSISYAKANANFQTVQLHKRYYSMSLWSTLIIVDNVSWSIRILTCFFATASADSACGTIIVKVWKVKFLKKGKIKTCLGVRHHWIACRGSSTSCVFKLSLICPSVQSDFDYLTLAAQNRTDQ